jgi:2-polyprenyl-3-methyl-5-hydroxy-6-metoxy-1,4-benzoquinol methylase
VAGSILRSRTTDRSSDNDTPSTAITASRKNLSKGFEMVNGDTALKRICPICNNDSGTIIHKQNFILEDNNPLPSNYKVAICNRCNFMFADLESSQARYDEFYSNMSKYENSDISSGSGQTDWDYKRLVRTADDIEKFCAQKTLRMLDIGPAQGGLMQIFLDRGYCDLSILEPSTKCIDAITSASHGLIKTAQGSLNSDLTEIFPNQTFDFITLTHVIEHVFDIETAIKNIKSICSEDTILYVEAPDAEEYLEYFKTPFHYFDIEHINHFDSHSLNLAFMKHGFKSIHASKKIIEASESEFYPAIFSLFQIKNIASSACKYIKHSEEFDFSHAFDPLIASNIPVAVWGCGSFTKSLLASSDINKCNIKLLIDVDVKKIGSTIGGFKICDPEALRSFRGAIIVSSALYTTEIINQIREMNLDNEVINLR